MILDNDAMLMAQKFRDAEEKVAEEQGDFYLFGLFERQNAPGRWDLVAAAPWLKTDRDGTVQLIVLLRDKMDTEDWKIVAGVFPIEPSAEYVKWMTAAYSLNHQVEEVFDPGRSGIYVGHAILITSNPNPSPVLLTREPVAA